MTDVGQGAIQGEEAEPGQKAGASSGVILISNGDICVFFNEVRWMQSAFVPNSTNTSQLQFLAYLFGLILLVVSALPGPSVLYI